MHSWAAGQQTIRGTIIDQDTQQPIPFSTLYLQNSEPLIGTTADDKGNFRLENIPLGRHSFVVSSVGYEPALVANVEVTSGKEVVLRLSLVESLETLNEVTIVAERDKSVARNEMASVSARSLTIEEAGRYAASFQDPARQALNFAGVASGGDDILNEIVIRGNSPRGLLWRLEGVEIPNPNHFAELGSSGGGISMLSSNVMQNSDFFTGAFPAEFGNALSGVFDLSFRRGNEEKRETSLGAGFLGLQAAAEGPFKQGGDASYLFNYRFSTLGILSALGVDVAGDFAPNYQNLSFNVHLPNSGLGDWSIFGLAGNNWGTVEDEFNTFKEDDEQTQRTGIVGIKNRIFLSEKSYLNTVLVASYQENREQLDSISFADNSTNRTFANKSQNESVRVSSFVNHKFNARHTIRTGVIWSRIGESLLDQGANLIDGTLTTFTDIDASSNMLQAYGQWKWRLSPTLVLNSGIHYLHFLLNDQTSIEPRAGLRWQAGADHAFSFGAGIHSKIELLIGYVAEQTTETGEVITPNRNMDMSKAAHLVVGYDLNLNDHTRFKVETYYQYLYDVPVSSNPEIPFSTINAFGSFDFVNRQDRLVNNGEGRNYGLEFTLERFLHRRFYYLLTLSLYESQFKFRDTYFDTRFNGNYVFNGLVGREFRLKNPNKTLGINTKLALYGGQRFTPIDIPRSIEADRAVFSEIPFSDQLDDYWRIDIGLNYKINTPNALHTFSLNVQNVTNRINEFNRISIYDPERDDIRVFLVGKQVLFLYSVIFLTFDFTNAANSAMFSLATFIPSVIIIPVLVALISILVFKKKKTKCLN